MLFTDCDEFTRGYIICAMWTSTSDDGEPLDTTLGPSDIEPESLLRLATDCTTFQENNADDLALAGDAGQNGHDFWLTRNRNGAGFWDRGYGEVGRRLTDAAHIYGESNLYVGDDGKIYVR